MTQIAPKWLCVGLAAVTVGGCREAVTPVVRDALQAHVAIHTGTLEIAVSNSSDEFVCVPASAFDSTRGNLVLKRPDGTPVETRSRANAAQQVVLGFDFADSYFVLQPREQRDFYADLGNFIVSAGTYEYELLFPYFECADVVDSRRVEGKRAVAAAILKVTGTLSLDHGAAP